MVWLPERGDLVNYLAAELRPGDLCISMGCGDISTLPTEVISQRYGHVTVFNPVHRRADD